MRAEGERTHSHSPPPLIYQIAPSFRHPPTCPHPQRAGRGFPHVLRCFAIGPRPSSVLSTYRFYQRGDRANSGFTQVLPIPRREVRVARPQSKRTQPPPDPVDTPGSTNHPRQTSRHQGPWLRKEVVSQRRRDHRLYSAVSRPVLGSCPLQARRGPRRRTEPRPAVVR